MTSLAPISTVTRSVSAKLPVSARARSICAVRSSTLAPGARAKIWLAGLAWFVGLHSRRRSRRRRPGSASRSGRAVQSSAVPSVIERVDAVLAAVAVAASSARWSRRRRRAARVGAKGSTCSVPPPHEASRPSSTSAPQPLEGAPRPLPHQRSSSLQKPCMSSGRPPQAARRRAAGGRARRPIRRSAGGSSTQMRCTPSASSSRSTANNSCAAAAALSGMRRCATPRRAGHVGARIYRQLQRRGWSPSTASALAQSALGISRSLARGA